MGLPLKSYPLFISGNEANFLWDGRGEWEHLHSSPTRGLLFSVNLNTLILILVQGGLLLLFLFLSLRGLR